jgi:hypothetical protein
LKAAAFCESGEGCVYKLVPERLGCTNCESWAPTFVDTTLTALAESSSLQGQGEALDPASSAWFSYPGNSTWLKELLDHVFSGSSPSPSTQYSLLKINLEQNNISTFATAFKTLCESSTPSAEDIQAELDNLRNAIAEKVPGYFPEPTYSTTTQEVISEAVYMLYVNFGIFYPYDFS